MTQHERLREMVNASHDAQSWNITLMGNTCESLLTEYDAAQERIRELEAALRRVDRFLTNGIGLGYIRMPDKDLPDPAHEVPGIVRAALQKVKP